MVKSKKRKRLEISVVLDSRRVRDVSGGGNLLLASLLRRL
jgi:hypothetical protein